MTPVSYRSSLKKLNVITSKRSKEVLEKFRSEATSSIANSEMIHIINVVKKYWTDFQRPALTSFSCEAVGGNPTATTGASVMITLTAAGMGIHDDIIDKTDFKHIRHTIPKLFGIDKGLLIGDILIIKGLIFAHRFLERTCPPVKKNAVMKSFQDFIFEIYEGELEEISCRKNFDIDLDEFSKIIWKLTADGEACTRIGAILGGASENEIQTLADFGRRLAFVNRLAEELRDSFDEEGNLAHRLEYESIPLPILYAAKSPEYGFEMRSLLQRKPLDIDTLQIAKICLKSKAADYIFQKAEQKAKEAIHSLCSIGPSEARKTLSLMLRIPRLYIKKKRDFEKRYAR